MAAYTWHDPHVEIYGQNVVGFIMCTHFESIRPFLAAHDLLDVRPDQWYPLHRFLAVLSDISEAKGGGEMMDFVSIGMKMAELAPYPPEYARMSFAEITMDSDRRYQMRHRGGDPGKHWPGIIDDTHVFLKYHVPYPDDLTYGVVYGQARKFLPPGTDITVYYDPDTPRHDEGGEATTVHVRWK